MRKKNKIFTDFSKAATNVLGSFSGIKEEVETIVKIRIEKVINKANLVKRDEFEVFKKIIQDLSKKNIELEKVLKKLQKKRKIVKRKVKKY
tara:strand:- start:385 stop:657 length:273 start_codon:yes stop_codon:yes gene_type:complete